MDFKKIRNKALLAGTIAVSVLTGAIGVSLFNMATYAQTSTPAATSLPVPPDKTVGKFKSNEDPAHEAKESTQREAEEDAN